MITLNNIDKLEWFIRNAVRSKSGRGAITTVLAYYTGSEYNSEHNILNFTITYDVKSIYEGELKSKRYTEGNKVKFREDYSKVEQTKWDALLNGIKFSGSHQRTNYMFNESDNYFNILQNLYTAFHTKYGRSSIEALNGLKEQMLLVDGLTTQLKGGTRTFILDLTNSQNSDLFLLETKGKNNFIIKHFIKGKIYGMTSNGKEVKTTVGTYKRLPNGTSQARKLIMERVYDNKYVFDGNTKPRGAYHRAVNSINISVLPFSIEDNDIYLNSHKTMFRVEINEDKGTIGFYHLTTNREGTKAGGDYYLGTLFNGEFSGLQMWGDVPEWFLDAHVLSDIYADHIEGKYGTDGKIGNL